jgi:hypothetical protein
LLHIYDISLSYLELSKDYISDNDIVLIIDAYDVILLPAITRLGFILEQSNTPVISCGEMGKHPEMSLASVYNSGNSNLYSSNINNNRNKYYKYLNSGCIVGRAKEIKNIFSYASIVGQIYRDDQQFLSRYHIRYPDILSLDQYNEIFLTGFGITFLSLSLSICLIYLSIYLSISNIFNTSIYPNILSI